MRPSGPPRAQAKHAVRSRSGRGPRRPPGTRTQAPPAGRPGRRCARGVGGLRPDRAVGVDADAVRARRRRPRPAVRSASRRRPMSNAVSRPANDSATISVGPSGVTPCRSGTAMSSATCRTRRPGSTSAMIAGLRRAAAEEVEAGAVEVDVAAPVDDDLVPAVLGDPGRSAWRTMRAVGLLAQQLRRRSTSSRPSGSQSIAQPEPRWAGGRSTSLRPSMSTATTSPAAPVGEPEPAVVPAARTRP